MTIIMRFLNSEINEFLCSLNSLMHNNVIKKLFIFCEDDSATYIDQVNSIIADNSCEVEFVKLDSVQLISNDRNCEILSMIVSLEEKISSGRVMYLSNDTIILNDISNLYNSDFQGRHIIARAQTIEGFERVGVSEEKGQLFDARVLIFNLLTIHKLPLNEKIAKLNYEYKKIKTEQGFLNCLFKEDALLIYDIKYNFRYSIYSMAELHGINIELITPAIISFERRDYFFAGFTGKPVEFALDDETIEYGIDNKLIMIPYRLQKTFLINIKIFKIWNRLQLKIDKNKLEEIYNKSNDLIMQNYTDNYKIVVSVLERIKNGQKVEAEDLKKVSYYNLNRYVDTLKDAEAVALIKKTQDLCASFMKGKTIKVGYIVYSSSEWQCEMLYEMFEKNPHFENYIFITYLNMRDQYVINEAIKNTMMYFKGRKNVVNLCAGDTSDKLIEEMDVLIYFSPFELKPDIANIHRRNTSQLCVHIPYAFYIENKDDMRYGDTFYDRLFFRMLWRYYASCERDVEYASERQRFQGYNIRFSGLPKIDEFIDKSFCFRENLWKESDSTKIRILWAPHFNMIKGMNGTFHENYRWFLDYAKKHKEISWIVKPHPRMKAGVIESGVFKNVHEYEDYLKEWNALDNGRVIEYGDYYDIFETSDAMILDCLSFIIEYLYSGKPQLFLLPEIPRELGGIGLDVINVLYKTRANDYEQIKKFINNCINKKDDMKNTRLKFVESELAYYNKNGSSASEYIFKELESLI